MIVSNDVIHDPRVLKEARALENAGHQVSIIGWDRTGRAPSFEEWNGLEIRRVQTRGLMRILWKDLIRIPVWWSKAYSLARRSGFDAVHCHDVDTLPIGVRLKRVLRRPLIYDCHEVFHRMIQDDVPRFVSRYVHRLEQRLAPQADRIIVVSHVVQEYIKNLCGRDSTVIANYPDFTAETYRPPPGPPFTVLYIGTLHPNRFVLPAIDVIAEMPDVQLVIAGSKQLTPIVKARCEQHPNTHFIGLVPNNHVMSLILNSHVVLAMFDPSVWINYMGLPNKLFEAMAAGRPSIVADEGLMAEIVNGESCGVAVPYSAEGFRQAVERLSADPSLAERMGRNGLAAASREYNWPKEERKLTDLYANLDRSG